MPATCTARTPRRGASYQTLGDSPTGVKRADDENVDNDTNHMNYAKDANYGKGNKYGNDINDEKRR
jgi:hypothetical protein